MRRWRPKTGATGALRSYETWPRGCLWIGVLLMTQLSTRATVDGWSDQQLGYIDAAAPATDHERRRANVIRGILIRSRIQEQLGNAGTVEAAAGMKRGCSSDQYVVTPVQF